MNQAQYVLPEMFDITTPRAAGSEELAADSDCLVGTKPGSDTSAVAAPATSVRSQGVWETARVDLGNIWLRAFFVRRPRARITRSWVLADPRTSLALPTGRP